MTRASPSSGYSPLRIFTFVVQPEVLIIWALFSPLVFLLLMVGNPLILIAWIILGIPFMQFSLNLIETTARGQQRAPRMTWDGVHDSRIYKQLLVTSAWTSAVLATPPPWRQLTLLAALTTCPAMTAFIAMENSLAAALNPLRIALFIKNMGLSYVTLRAVVSAFLVYLALVFAHSTTLTPSVKIVFSIASVYLMLVLCRSTGALLFSRRRELGIRTVASPEQDEARRENEITRERDDFLAEMYKLASAGRKDDAWVQIEKRLKRDRYASEHAYYDALAKWEDPTLSHKLAQGYLKRLVQTAPELAWPILERIDEQCDGDYRLDSGGAVLEFARFASTHRQKRIALGLLRYFDEDFSTHPRRREALLIGADLACQLDELELARGLFDRVKRMRGLVHKPTFDRCRRLIEA